MRSSVGDVVEYHFTSPLLYCCIALVALLAFLLLKPRVGQNGDAVYARMDHLAFNVKGPTTEWYNMGDWSNTEDFVTANRQLALRLIDAAGVKTGAAILDVGCGCGDSLLLLLQEQQYRPRLLHGVTSIRTHAERARHRVEQYLQGTSNGEYIPEVEVHCQDAVRFCEEHDVTVKYDFILALDCAYHFETRQRFLNAASKLLKLGGTIALQDLVAAHPYTAPKQGGFLRSPSLSNPTQSKPSYIDTVKQIVTLHLAGVPQSNMVSVAEYAQHLHDAGLTKVSIEDVTHAVFPGFAKFFQRIGKGEDRSWRGVGALQLIALHQFGEVVERWSLGGERGLVRSVTVVASKVAENE